MPSPPPPREWPKLVRPKQRRGSSGAHPPTLQWSRHTRRARACSHPANASPGAWWRTTRVGPTGAWASGTAAKRRGGTRWPASGPDAFRSATGRRGPSSCSMRRCAGPSSTTIPAAGARRWPRCRSTSPPAAGCSGRGTPSRTTSTATAIACARLRGIPADAVVTELRAHCPSVIRTLDPRSVRSCLGPVDQAPCTPAEEQAWRRTCPAAHLHPTCIDWMLDLAREQPTPILTSATTSRL